MSREEEQLIQKLRNELLSGADTMISTDTDVWAEYFDMFRKLCHGLLIDEIKSIYKEITPVCEQLYGTPDKATNTFEVLSKLYVTYQCWKSKDPLFDFDKGLRGAYVYVYTQLYMDTLPDFYQRGSAIEYSEPLDKEQEALKWFALTLDRCGFKNFTIYETFPGTIILRGEKYYELTSVKPRSVKYPKVTNRITKAALQSGLSIGYDMFTLKFKELTD